MKTEKQYEGDEEYERLEGEMLKALGWFVLVIVVILIGIAILFFKL